MRLLTFFVLLFLISISSACIFELRSATFYVNGTQEVTRDWFVIDFTNNYGYTLLDVHFSDLAFVSVIRDGERVRIDPYKNVSPRIFPIAVFAKVESFGNQSVVRYVLENYGESTEVSVLIPMFQDFISCDNCVISNEGIIFNKTIAKNESASFNLTLKRDFTIPDGKISFSYHGKIDMNFTANIPVIVEKGRGENWVGIFKVSNVLDKKLKGNVTAFVEIGSNRTTLFHEEIELDPGENFERSEEVKSQLVPIFYFQVQLRVEDYCNLTTLPATEIEGRYVVGYATLKGFTHTAPAVIPVVPGPPIPEIVTVPTPEIPRTPEVTRIEAIEVVPEILIPPPRVAKEVVVQYVVMMVPAIFGTFFATIFFPVHSKRGIVAIREHERVLVKLYPKFRVFTVPSSPVRRGVVIEPDEELVFRLLEMGIDRKYAELIAVAIKVKKPAIVGDANVARIAVSLGIPVIVYGRS